MNKEKIQKVLKQLDIAITSINDDNCPELKRDDIKESSVLNENTIYNQISDAYQILDEVSNELTKFLEVHLGE